MELIEMKIDEVKLLAGIHYMTPPRRSSMEVARSFFGNRPRVEPISPFHIHYASGSRIIKGEDVQFIESLYEEQADTAAPQDIMCMVCDGHSGIQAAEFVAAYFHQTICSKLPSKQGLDESLNDMDSFAADIRRAIYETFVSIENEWVTIGHLAGTTVTVVLVLGNLLTVANVGDSSAVLDTGCSMMELTACHRIQTDKAERERLQKAGCQIAPLGFHLQGPAKPNDAGVGPLRIWPGGLCVSRSIGDIDAGPEIVPVPHIKQILLPCEGCRIIIASDGLWDVLTLDKAVKLSRMKSTSAAASALVDSVLRDQRFMDDTTVIVMDVMPPGSSSFPTVALKAGLHPIIQERKKKPGGMCSCFYATPEEPDCRYLKGEPGHLELFSDVDCLQEFSYERVSKECLPTSFSPKKGIARAASGVGQDFTLHNAQIYFPGQGRQPSGMLGGPSTSARPLDLSVHSAAAPLDIARNGSDNIDVTTHSEVRYLNHQLGSMKNPSLAFGGQAKIETEKWDKAPPLPEQVDGRSHNSSLYSNIQRALIEKQGTEGLSSLKENETEPSISATDIETTVLKADEVK